MKSVEQILSRLESLTSVDRQWIVERLPDHAKSLLMNELTVTELDRNGEANSNQGYQVNGTDKIEVVLPALAAAILQTESAWIITTLLRQTNKTWMTMVLDALPTTLRYSVTAALQDSHSMPSAVVASLRCTFLRRAAIEHSFVAPISAHSPWRKLLNALKLGDAA